MATFPTSTSKLTPFVLSSEQLESSSWKTFDPFLFCAYHKEDYPPASSDHDDHASMGPDPRALAGRALGHDFSKLNGFSMYHGRIVPGFPAHRHFGFETVTIVRKGFVDHFDSLGGVARYGENDVQWLSAGSGIVHSEMFPLLDHQHRNPLEIIQIWLNLPAGKKNTPPAFHMGWAEDQAVKRFGDAPHQAELRLIAGSMFGMTGMTPPPNSYACSPEAALVIAVLKLNSGSSMMLPPSANETIHRALYMFGGSSVHLQTKSVESSQTPEQFTIQQPFTMVTLKSDVAVELSCGGEESPSELLFLQGLPLREPVFQSGPYVASSRAELLEVMMEPHHDVWPFKILDPVHSKRESRFFRAGKDSTGSGNKGKQRPPSQPA